MTKALRCRMHARRCRECAKVWTQSWTASPLAYLCLLLITSILLLALGRPALAGDAPKAGKEDEGEQVSKEEIDALVRDLGNSSKEVGKKAYKRLQEIGPPALRGLRKEMLGNNPEAVRLSLQLVADLQTEYGIQSVRAGGLEFTVVADSVWALPAPGEQCDVKVGVRMVNCGKLKTSLVFINAIRFSMIRADGTRLPDIGGRDHIGTWLTKKPPVLNPGDGYTFFFQGMKLRRSVDGKDLRLEGEDGCCGFCYPGLTAGRYVFCVFCRNKFDLPGSAGTAQWQGDVACPLVAVEIK